jgi:hypothetical protein
MNQFTERYMASLLWRKLHPEAAKFHWNAYISFIQRASWMKRPRLAAQQAGS